MPVIYKITSPSGRIYIGQSCNIDKRFGKYRNLKCEGQPILHNSLKKYGYRSHAFEIIHELPIDVKQEVIDEYEILYWELYIDCGIKMLNAREPGRGGRQSEESKRLISRGNTGKKHSEATKALLAQKSTGNSYARGHIHTIEARRKISDRKTGIKWTEERRLRAKGRKKILKGPRIKDRTVYHFVNILTMEAFIGIRHDFKLKYSLKQESVHRLVSGEYKNSKGWVMLHNAGSFIPGTEYVNI